MHWKFDAWDSDFAALNTDTTGVELETSVTFMSPRSMEFDKVNGDANTIFGAVTRTWTVEPASLYRLHDFGVLDRIGMVINVSSVTNIAYAFLRLGTSASHLLEWRFADTGLATTGWNVESANFADNYITGNGWNLGSGLLYMCVGVAFDGETNALADIRIDHLFGVFNTPTIS